MSGKIELAQINIYVRKLHQDRLLDLKKPWRLEIVINTKMVHSSLYDINSLCDMLNQKADEIENEYVDSKIETKLFNTGTESNRIIQVAKSIHSKHNQWSVKEVHPTKK